MFSFFSDYVVIEVHQRVQVGHQGAQICPRIRPATPLSASNLHLKPFLVKLV